MNDKKEEVIKLITDEFYNLQCMIDKNIDYEKMFEMNKHLYNFIIKGINEIFDRRE